MGRAVLVGLIVVLVALGGYGTLQYRLPVGPGLLVLAVVPLAALKMSGRRLQAAIPDLVFGAIDTLVLLIPAVAGGTVFGVVGAVVGGVLGDALSDGIAGFFEGSIAEWLRRRGFEESREAVTTSLGKMSGCLLGGGAGFLVASLFGVGLPWA